MVRFHRSKKQEARRLYREPPEVENPHNRIVEQLHRQEKQSHLQILRQQGKELHPKILRQRGNQSHLQILRQRDNHL